MNKIKIEIIFWEFMIVFIAGNLLGIKLLGVYSNLPLLLGIGMGAMVVLLESASNAT